MIQQMENSIALGRKMIDTELDTGFLNFIIRPIVKTFYDHWAQNDVRGNTLKQINLTLNAGLELLKNGVSDETFSKVVDKNLPKYLNADQTHIQVAKGHKNYERLKQAAKETFINYLKEVVKLLDVKEDVKNYGDLCRVAFNSKEVAERNLMNQLSFTDKGIKIVEEDLSILRIPVGRRIIVKTLRKGFIETKKELIKSLNETYDQKE